MELRICLVCRSIASDTTAGEGGSGMLAARFEDFRAISLPGVFKREDLVPLV